MGFTGRGMTEMEWNGMGDGSVGEGIGFANYGFGGGRLWTHIVRFIARERRAGRGSAAVGWWRWEGWRRVMRR